MELESAGHDVVIQDLVGAAKTGDPAVFVRAAVEAIDDSSEPAVLVGHSGAGAMLPLVAASVTAEPRAVVFVDAGIPPCDEAFSAGGPFLEVLRNLATDGLLPKWSTWWGDGVLDAMVPDNRRRREFEGELPIVPLRFYDAMIEVPAGWCTRPCSYLLLSEIYRSDLERVTSLGWLVAEHPGNHLDIMNHEAAISDLLLDLSNHP